MKAVVLGATKGMGRALARQAAARGDALFLLGRNVDDLERSAADCTAHSPGDTTVGFALCDLAEPDGFSAALDAADEALDGFDTVVVTAGLFGRKSSSRPTPIACAPCLRSISPTPSCSVRPPAPA